jgi:formylglycine-generating enzyme required for sulfatase activity
MTLIRADRVQTVETFLSLLDSKTPDTSDNEETVCEEACKAAEEEQKRREGGTSSKTFTFSGVSFDMVKVQAGSFTMGATSEMKAPESDEKPTHQVTLTNDYYIGKTEVTQALWKAVMGNNPSYFKGDNLPVESVNWDDCQKFISKLNSLTGQIFRLPTEAEWEFAARGGNNSNHYQYSGSNELGDVAWYDGNSGSKTHAVATKQPNELGLYDMSGNVWEWCSDWFGNYSSSSQTNPTGPNSGSGRVFRGGSWNYNAHFCRSSFRFNFNPDYSYYSQGLRLVLVP